MVLFGTNIAGYVDNVNLMRLDKSYGVWERINLNQKGKAQVTYDTELCW